MPIVARAARESRVLVSASRRPRIPLPKNRDVRLIQRADAALAYFIDAREFNLSLAKLCIDASAIDSSSCAPKDLAVDLQPDRFFTRCVKCNGQGPGEMSRRALRPRHTLGQQRKGACDI